MPLPNLLHPVPIEIERLDRSATLVDDDFREPIQSGSRATRATVPGQVMWEKADAANPTAIGSEQLADGYVLFRRIDLRSAFGEDLKQGDRFVAFGSGDNRFPVDVYVVRLQPMGHYGDRSGATLLRAWFKDRSPSKQNAGGL